MEIISNKNNVFNELRQSETINVIALVFDRRVAVYTVTLVKVLITSDFHTFAQFDGHTSNRTFPFRVTCSKLPERENLNLSFRVNFYQSIINLKKGKKINQKSDRIFT
jgi:hypothetical protein